MMRRWKVVLASTGEKIGEVIASDYATALGAGVSLAAKTTHKPQKIDVVRIPAAAHHQKPLGDKLAMTKLERDMIRARASLIIHTQSQRRYWDGLSGQAPKEAPASKELEAARTALRAAVESLEAIGQTRFPAPGTE